MKEDKKKRDHVHFDDYCAQEANCIICAIRLYRLHIPTSHEAWKSINNEITRLKNELLK